MQISKLRSDIGTSTKNGEKMKNLTVDYKDELLQDLQDPSNCAEYLSFCLAESKETFLMGLKNVAEAQGGMTKLASGAQVNPENLYRMLSDDGNPRLDSLTSIMAALGLDINIVPSKPR
jgi:probable addiction module antidote protein